MREQTQAARASKAIKAELKGAFPNVKFSVKSSNFSMGDSVDISWTDGPTPDKVEAITSKYQYGKFDGMTDMYNNTNDRADIPQSKFVMCSRTITKEYFNIVRPLIEAIWTDANSYDIDNYTYRILRRNDIYSPVLGIASSGVTAGQVEDLYILRFAEVDKPEAKEIILGSFELVDYSEKAIALFGDTKPIKDILKDLGRFNSNLKYGEGKKAGWVFSKKMRPQIEALINSDSLAPGQPIEKIEINLSDSLYKKAESTQKAADSIDSSVKGNWTHRRQSQADSMKDRKEKTERTAKILFTLSDMWKDGTIEERFKFIKSRAHVEFITFNGCFPTPPDPGFNGWYNKEYPKLKAKVDGMGITSKDQFNLLKEDLKAIGTNEKTPDQIKAEKIAALELKMRGVNIPGFFPTPDKLIDQLLEAANIQPGEMILEPSAGLGSIADKVKELHPDNEIYCIEVQYTLCEILKAKGFEVIDNDFLQYSNGRTYDKIIMNPPFENSQDIAHLKHAYDLLNTDGRVVCVMAANKKDDFNNWLDDVGGYFEENENNSFSGAEAFRSTGVNTITVVIDK